MMSPFTLPELRSFRVLKLFNAHVDKGVGIVKVKSLSKELCAKLQHLRSRYFIGTTESYFNKPEDIANIIRFADSFDFHLVSCERVRQAIVEAKPEAKCIIMGAGEYLTDPELFKLENTGKRKIDFIASANSFWTLKNFHKVFDIQRMLTSKGVASSSRILCGSIRDHAYYEQCLERSKQCKSSIVIGTNVRQLKDYYNRSKFLVHLSANDSSPRVVFEALLCGCQCILQGRWTETLNDWLKSPLVHVINDFDEIPDVLAKRPDYDLSKSYTDKLGLKNLACKIDDVCKSLQPTFATGQFMQYSCVGKETFYDRRMEREMLTVRGLLR